MSNFHTTKFGCGCSICMEQKPHVEFPGVEESARRQAEYVASRYRYAESVGRPIKRQKVRGMDD